MGPFRKFPEKSRKVTCLTIGIVPELKQLVTQANHNKNLIFLIADIALRYTVETTFANLHK